MKPAVSYQLTLVIAGIGIGFATAGTAGAQVEPIALDKDGFINFYSVVADAPGDLVFVGAKPGGNPEDEDGTTTAVYRSGGTGHLKVVEEGDISTESPGNAVKSGRIPSAAINMQGRIVYEGGELFTTLYVAPYQELGSYNNVRPPSPESDNVLAINGAGQVAYSDREIYFGRTHIWINTFSDPSDREVFGAAGIEEVETTAMNESGQIGYAVVGENDQMVIYLRPDAPFVSVPGEFKTLHYADPIHVDGGFSTGRSGVSPLGQ